ncbi:hypothetical protein [Vibrio crassostreae]|uniref:hypothetical protein n=1 Tax=Vibrio crassostreae TaxID=246167 RepID=UPI001B30DCEA|nr:hypothetical protein [Vibrio crassostreae]
MIEDVVELKQELNEYVELSWIYQEKLDSIQSDVDAYKATIENINNELEGISEENSSYLLDNILLRGQVSDAEDKNTELIDGYGYLSKQYNHLLDVQNEFREQANLYKDRLKAREHQLAAMQVDLLHFDSLKDKLQLALTENNNLKEEIKAVKESKIATEVIEHHQVVEFIDRIIKYDSKLVINVVTSIQKPTKRDIKKLVAKHHPDKGGSQMLFRLLHDLYKKM